MELTDKDQQEYAGTNNGLDALNPDKKMEQYKQLGRQSDFDIALRGVIDSFMPLAGAIHEHGDPDNEKGNDIIKHFADGIRKFRVYIKESTKEDSP